MAQEEKEAFGKQIMDTTRVQPALPGFSNG